MHPKNTLFTRSKNHDDKGEEEYFRFTLQIKTLTYAGNLIKNGLRSSVHIH